MKKITFIFLLPVVLCSCKTYHYYTLPVNQATFANKGEVQAGAGYSTSGGVVNGGVALTDKICIAGQHNGPIGGSYNAWEGEGAIGFKTGVDSRGNTITIYAGYGQGTNYKQDSGAVLRTYMGDYTRGFLQFGVGSTQGHIGKVKVGGTGALKLNYIDYSGFKESSGSYVPFTASNYFMDIYLSANIGGKYWRFEYGQAFVLKTDLKSVNNPDHSLHIFPVSVSIGLKIILGRKYEE